MQEYIVTLIDDNKTCLVEGDFLPDSIAVNLPTDDPSRKKYISLFIQKTDIELAIECTRCISEDKYATVNHALFLTALANLIKCFQSNEKWPSLNENMLKKNVSASVYENYERFKELRNKHYFHEVNNMVEATAFLILPPEGSDSIPGWNPSVVTNKLDIIRHTEESRKLEELLLEVLRIIISEIDKVHAYLSEVYGTKTRDELLSYGSATMKLGSFRNEHAPQEYKIVLNPKGRIVLRF